MFTLNNNELLMLESAEGDDYYNAYYYTCNVDVKCETGIVNVTGVNVFNNEELHIIYEGDDVYGDREFETAISRLLGINVMFTEAGMQDDGIASMELA